MANRNGMFAAGHGKDPASNTGVPTSSADASGIIQPSAEREVLNTPSTEMGTPATAAPARVAKAPANETTRMIKEHDKLTGTRAVKLKDAISIASRLGDQLHVIHQDELKTGRLHPGLAEARTHLFGDANYPADDDRSKGAVHFIAQAKLFHNPERMPIVKNGVELKSTDNLAWTALEKAGSKLIAAHKSLLSATPKAADVSVEHPVKGVPMVFTPDTELAHITSNPTPFREQGDAPKDVEVAGRKVSTERIKDALIRQQVVSKERIGGVDEVREDLRTAAKKAIKGTKRTRKTDKPGGKGPVPGQITPETTVFKDIEPGVAIPATQTETAPSGKKRPAKPLAQKNPKAVTVEPMGKGVEDINKPKKQPRPAPTEEKAMKNVEREGK